ncbi:MAG: hypothetical protein V3V45_01915 [Candidatus Brocadiales bacterium]
MDTNTQEFLRDRQQRLLDRAGGRPYMYLSLTPAEISGPDDVIDVTNPAVVDLLRNPPNFREGGWGIYRTEPRPTPDGFLGEFQVSVLRDTQRLELLRNGHLELSVKIDDKRFDIEYVSRNGRDIPTLYVYPLCEIPLNFLRLGSDIFDAGKCRTDGVMVTGMGLYNIRGYSLCACGRNTEGYKRQFSENNFPLWQEEHLILHPEEVPSALEPGPLAKKLAGELWRAFGFREPPALFDRQGRFRP